nr:hypothetical protein [Tanacetum cinerariifolium]
MAMAAFESQYIDKDTYSAFAEDIEVQSCFLDDQLTNLSPPRNYDLSSNVVQKGIVDRMSAYLINQHDEMMSPFGLEPTYKRC